VLIFVTKKTTSPFSRVSMPENLKVTKKLISLGLLTGAVTAPFFLPVAMMAAIPMLGALLQSDDLKHLLEKSGEVLGDFLGDKAKEKLSARWRELSGITSKNEDLARALVESYRLALKELIDAPAGESNLLEGEKEAAERIYKILPGNPAAAPIPELEILFPVSASPETNHFANTLSVEEVITTLVDDDDSGMKVFVEDVRRSLRRWNNIALNPDSSIYPVEYPLPGGDDGRLTEMTARKLSGYLHNVLNQEKYKNSWIAYQRGYLKGI
jgi:hypothetical protein